MVEGPHVHFEPPDSMWICPEAECDYVWEPPCQACGYVEKGVLPSGFYASSDAVHDDLCCGSTKGCFWKEDVCVTHMSAGPVAVYIL